MVNSECKACGRYLAPDEGDFCRDCRQTGAGAARTPDFEAYFDERREKAVRHGSGDEID